jgi:hypothetical protein
MTDQTQAAPAATPVTNPEVKRESIALHELISAPGGEHTDIQSAVGIRYTDKASKTAFEYIIPGAQPGTPLTMLALFGAKTKATNETSRVRNGAGGDTTAQMEALDEVFESITNGVWREKAEGGGGTRTDKELLAQVLVEMLGEKANPGGVDHYVARFNDGEEGLKYMRLVLKSEAGEAYRKRVGKAQPALATLA